MLTNTDSTSTSENSDWLCEINRRLTENRLTWLEVRFILQQIRKIALWQRCLGHLDYGLRHRLAASDWTWFSLVRLCRNARLNGIMPDDVVALHYALYPEEKRKDTWYLQNHQ